jgi:hypothetical protein
MGRQRPVQLERLFRVDQHGPVEVAQAAARVDLRQQHPERGQHLLLDPLGVLGGELQFAQRVAEAGPHPHRVEQRVRGRPRALPRLAGHADQAVVEGHGDLAVRRVTVLGLAGSKTGSRTIF